jgi:hypothetical protein
MQPNTFSQEYGIRIRYIMEYFISRAINNLHKTDTKPGRSVRLYRFQTGAVGASPALTNRVRLGLHVGIIGAV